MDVVKQEMNSMTGLTMVLMLIVLLTQVEAPGGILTLAMVHHVLVKVIVMNMNTNVKSVVR